MIRQKGVEITSWSISKKVLDRAEIKLATPGSAVRHASVARHVTDLRGPVGKFWKRLLQKHKVIGFTRVEVAALLLGRKVLT